MRSLAIFAGMVSLAVALAGCDIHVLEGKKKVYAQYKPEGKQMLIVPFRDPAFDFFENDSPAGEGVVIASFTAEYIRKHDITPVYDGYGSQPLKTAYETNKEDYSEALKAMAESTNSDLVLVGKISPVVGNSFYLGGSNTNLRRAAMHISVQLYDMTEGGRCVWRMEDDLAFPEGNEYEFGVPAGDIKRPQLKAGITALAAKKIGRAFHDHLEPR